MKKTEAIALAGNGKKLAALLGISSQAVYAWPDEVPQLQVFRLKELRPKWFRKPKQAPAPKEPQASES